MNWKLEQVQEVVEFARGHGVFVSLHTSYGSSLEEYGILPAFVELAQADSCYNRWLIRTASSLLDASKAAVFCSWAINVKLGHLRNTERKRPREIRRVHVIVGMEFTIDSSLEPSPNFCKNGWCHGRLGLETICIILGDDCTILHDGHMLPYRAMEAQAELSRCFFCVQPPNETKTRKCNLSTLLRNGSLVGSFVKMV